MKDLILKFLFKADSSGVRKEIKRIENDGRKASDKIGNGLKRAFTGLGTAIAGIGIGRIFKSAVDDAAKLEQSLLKLRAAAQNTGQDFDTIEKGLQRLRSEGTLSFQTITEASQQLLQQGFQADDIEPFLRALRNIGALENTVGDTNEAMRSFIRAISTNSIELVDNLSPALRKTVLELGGFNEIAKNADKQQQFLNITLDRGAQFADAYSQSIETVAGKQAQLDVETEKLSEAFGKALAPAFESSLDFLTPLVKGLTDFLEALTPAQKSIVAAGAAAVTATIGFAGLAVAIGASATAMTVLTGGLVVAGAALATYSVSQAAVNKEVNEARGRVKGLESELKKLSKIKGTEKDRARLTRELANAQKVLNNALNDRIAKEKNLLSLGKAERKLAISKAQQARSVALGRLIELAGGGIRPLNAGEIIALSGTAAQAESLRGGFFGRGVGPFDTSRQRANIAGEQFNILVEQQRIIENLEKANREYNKTLKDVGGGTQGASQGSQEFAESSKELAEVAETTGKTVFPTLIEALLDMAGRLDTAAYNVDTITGSIEVLGDESASASDKIRGLGEGLRGIGGILGQLGFTGASAGLGVASAGLGLIGAIGGLFESLFGSSENQESILDQQLELQRQQFALQKEQAGIEKKYFEDDLEIIRQRARIEGRDPSKEISSAIAAELTRLGFTGDISLESLELQRERVRQESESILQNKQLLQQAEVVQGLSQGTIGQRIVAIQDIARIREEAGLGRLTGDLGNIVNQTILELTALTQEGQAERIQQLLEQGVGLLPALKAPTTLTTKPASTVTTTEAQKIRQDIAKKEQDLQELIIEQNRGINRETEIQALQSDIDRLRTLLVLPEKPPETPLEVAAVTAPTAPTTLQRVQPRGFSFLDISRGGLQTAFGFAPSRAVEMVSGAGVPSQIGSLTVATEAMKTTEEKMLDTLDGQLSELKKQTDILSKLTGQDVTIAVLNAISAGQARSL